MSKIAKTAALIVGAVALVATGIGAAAGAGLIGGATASGAAGFLGVSAATFSAIGSIASIAALGLSAVSALTAKKGGASDYQATGSPADFALNPDAPVPMVVGRLARIGSPVFRTVRV